MKRFDESELEFNIRACSCSGIGLATPLRHLLLPNCLQHRYVFPTFLMHSPCRLQSVGNSWNSACVALGHWYKSFSYDSGSLIFLLFVGRFFNGSSLVESCIRFDDWVGTICRDNEDEVAIARFGAGFTVDLFDLLRVDLLPSTFAFESDRFVVEVFCNKAVVEDRAEQIKLKLVENRDGMQTIIWKTIDEMK